MPAQNSVNSASLRYPGKSSLKTYAREAKERMPLSLIPHFLRILRVKCLYSLVQKNHVNIRYYVAGFNNQV